MPEAFDHRPLDPLRRAEHALRRRLEELDDGGLRLPVTPGPFFVLLAQPIGIPDFDVTYGTQECDAAARKLLRARPGGYDISDRKLRFMPPHTFGSVEPNPTTRPDRFAYVHVTEDGLVELASGEVADMGSREIVGLGGIEDEIRKHDAQAIQEAFEELGVEGRVMVTVALLRTGGAKVRWIEPVPSEGVLGDSHVTIQPRCFATPSDLSDANLIGLVQKLWTTITRQALPVAKNGA
ncbi:hypothetical protein [Paraburkholderia sp. C35]|uniref:hypothetical protein n=1 Tax=Paraburkholderia sp. C35 TaxID=2126993 RepID=UPI000D68C8B8|nr:hypothetical protein [Paraburkholderia sp. C35]